MTDPADTHNDNDPVLTIRDLARRTSLSECFIYSQVINGSIEHYSFGGSRRKRGAIRFSERQFRQFLSQQEEHLVPVVGIPVSNIGQVTAITRMPGKVTNKLNKLLQQGRSK